MVIQSVTVDAILKSANMQRPNTVLDANAIVCIMLQAICLADHTNWPRIKLRTQPGIFYQNLLAKFLCQ